MTSEVVGPDVALLARISSIETKMRELCDLIPISTWGFSADVHEKLRERKHMIVNQHLTPKEKRTLTNNKKQQVARAVGSVYRRVSEVFELLSASRDKNSHPKVLPNVKSKKVESKEEQEVKKQVASKPSIKASSGSDSDDAGENVRPQTSLLRDFTNSERPGTASNANNGENSKTCYDDTIGGGIENVSMEGTRKRFNDKLAEVQPKKQKFVVSEVQCETKDATPDLLKQRELAIRKLQEKLKAMKASREGKSKATKDSSAVSKLEEKKKLKRRISKMKMKQRRAEERQPSVCKGTDTKTELETEKARNEAVSFSKFDFIVKHDLKKKRLTTSQKKQKFTGKDYKSLIKKVEKRDEKLEKLREREPEKAIEVEDAIKWNRAINKAQGIKVKDNMQLLQKGLKRKEKFKQKKKENWSNREAVLEREKEKKQEKRLENIQKRIDDKKKRKMKLMKKKGRIL